MRQFQFNFENDEKFVHSLRRIRQWCNSTMASAVFFQIYTEDLDHADLIRQINRQIHTELPDALVMGCSTSGNVLMGEKAPAGISLVCTIFEYAGSRIEIFQYPLTTETEQATCDSILSNIAERPWVKAVLLNTTIRGMSMSSFCDLLSNMDPSIQVFGGGAFASDMNDNNAFVFSSSGDVSDHSVVFALIGGEDIHVESTFITGWKPLGRDLKVTRAEGPILYELDNKPAYDTYFRYLNIKNDENFFSNTLEFPFFYEYHGINILRAPIASNPDGSLTMTAEMPNNVMAKIAYGDPWTILENTRGAVKELKPFAPEVIMIFSCAGRRAFWGDDEISKESIPFQMLAPTSGFYTSGEFLRTGKFVNQHNVTLVIAALREGPAVENTRPDLSFDEDMFSGKVSMINRLATFIQAATEELEEANKKLELAAISDGLTRLLNRVEIQHRITARAKELTDGNNTEPASLIMMDLDNFKQVNDTYGHREGDTVLKALAELLKRSIDEFAPGSLAGRWGGEEFMILLPGYDGKKAGELAEIIRTRFAGIVFPKAGNQTLSLGVTEIIPGEDSDISCMRVDAALYDAKHKGKNRVEVH